MNPRNCQLVRLKLESQKSAQILGRLAQEVITETNQIREQMTKTIEKPFSQLPQIEDAIMEDDTQIKEQPPKEDFSNFAEVEVSGIFIKHDFDHIILNEDEVEKYTNGKLTHSTMKQTLFVPYEYDI